MKKLHLIFLNEDGSKKTLVIRCVHQELTPAEVKEAMIQITELDLFEKDGVRLMTEVYSAKYVEIIETPLFDSVDSTVSSNEGRSLETNTATIGESSLTTADPQLEQEPVSIDDSAELTMVEKESSIKAVFNFTWIRSSVASVLRRVRRLFRSNKNTSRLSYWLKRWKPRFLLRC